MHRQTRLLTFVVSIALLYFVHAGARAADTIVSEGRTVTIEYSLALDDGTVVDSNSGEEGLIFKHGEGAILPALEDALKGAGPGETREITVAPADGFGNVNPEVIQEISLDKLPEDARQEGAILVISNEEGRQQTISIREIKEDKAVIDMNHPLAGQTLHYKVTVLSVK